MLQENERFTLKLMVEHLKEDKFRAMIIELLELYKSKFGEGSLKSLISTFDAKND